MKNNELIKPKMNLKMPLLLNMHEAAESLGVCYRTIQELVYQRKIGFVRVGRHYKFRQEDINNFINRNYVKPA